MLHPHTKSHQRSSEHMRLAVKLVPFCCPCSQKCHRLLDRHGDASEPSPRPGRQPSDSKFDLTVGELAPIFDNGRIATGWTFVEELAGLSPSLLHRQSETFMWQALIAAFALVAKIARPIRDAVRSSHCINLDVGGQSRSLTMFAIRQRASRIVITRQTVVLSRHVVAVARRPDCRALCALPAACRRGDVGAMPPAIGPPVRAVMLATNARRGDDDAVTVEPLPGARSRCVPCRPSLDGTTKAVTGTKR
jgi:hypothetical protein